MATTAKQAAAHQSLALLNHLSRVARREADAVLDRGGLRPRHLVALTLLRDHGAVGQQGLAEALRLDPSNLVGLLNELEQRHLISRTRDPSDRRRHIVQLAPEGHAALLDTEQRLACVEDRVLGALSAQERDTLHALLLRAAGDQLPSHACLDAECDQASSRSQSGSLSSEQTPARKRAAGAPSNTR
jgi:MarR family transcriptional regulator, lower aerobic nicotinate degradation pathway regulator